MDIYDVLISPRATEKDHYRMKKGFYSFRVHLKANKTQIKEAVQRLFNVDVEAVNTMRVLGKTRRARKNHAIVGKEPDWKKAIVKVKKDQTIQTFEGL